jgi:hypothetical protein
MSPSAIIAAQSSSSQPANTTMKSALTLRLAEIKSQAFGMLLSSRLDNKDDDYSANFDALFGIDNGNGTSASSSANVSNSDQVYASLMASPVMENGLTATGRNPALFDPESAYQMMTNINARDVIYKAEFVTMQDMKSYLTAMQDVGEALGGTTASTDNAAIHERLQGFADAYNGWIDHFDEDLQANGLLSGTQAAQVAQWELERSVDDVFTGAEVGLHGMRELGLTIDPLSNRASVDHTRLDSILATNKTAAITTVQSFSANFSKAAELLNSSGNFVPTRLDNLDRAIDFINDNKQDLQAEFGLGDPAKPSGKVAQALATYDAVYGMKNAA